MQFVTRPLLACALFFMAACEPTARENHRPLEALNPGPGAASASAGSASGAGGSGGDGSSGQGAGSGIGGEGTGGEAPCVVPDRVCDVTITYPLGSESSVELRGNFAPEGWSKGIPMTKGASLWAAKLKAPWGIDLQYKFVVDGSTWLADPSNSNKVGDGFGGDNSVLKAAACSPYACAPRPPLRFAVIGDYGSDALSEAGQLSEGKVAALVKTWKPDLIVTLGDNNYPNGLAETIDQNIGKYYSEFIHPYVGAYGPGGETNKFYPCLGNHDWNAGNVAPYTDYFTLPGNERYWELAAGPVRFFCVDSDVKEPDGVTATSVQGQWLEQALAAASEPLKIVIMHHPPYSSGAHGSNAYMQWPFAAWGADIVMGGHDHSYERLHRDEIYYFVNGLGGAVPYGFQSSMPGSQIRYAGVFGAMLADVAEDGKSIVFRAITTDNLLVDHVAIAPSP
jgi:hypothetical protein